MGFDCLPTRDLLRFPSTILPTSGRGLHTPGPVPFFLHGGKMIEFNIVDQSDHHNRIRVLGSKIGMLMVISIEEQMRALDQENDTDHNSYFDYIGKNGMEGDGSGTMIYGILKLLSVPNEEFWDFANACQQAIERKAGGDHGG